MYIKVVINDINNKTIVSKSQKHYIHVIINMKCLLLAKIFILLLHVLMTHTFHVRTNYSHTHIAVIATLGKNIFNIKIHASLTQRGRQR